MEVHMVDQRLADKALIEGHAAVESTKRDIDGHLKRLEGDLSTVRGSWQGAAATQFESLMAQWNENAEKVNRALQDLADNLNATNSSFGDNEAETENSFSQLLGGL
jgi:WXG100 family type VII secretion target